MARLLNDYLIEMASEPFQWGQLDCMLFLADWVHVCTHKDPATLWRRGVYWDEETAKEHLCKTAPGAMIAHALDRLGIEYYETEKPQPGDIGLLALPAGLTGVIKTQTGWAAKSPDGLALFRNRVAHGAWSIPACHQL
mgnify:CR=1 FL=1